MEREVDVRIATVADAAEVGRLLDAFNREFDDPTPGADVLAARLGRILAGDDCFAVLADSVGCAFVAVRPTTWYDGPAGYLEELYVAPEHRDAGIGTRLLHTVEAELTRRGSTYMEINVDAGDADAQRFYERHGYRNLEPGEELPAMYYFREWDGTR